MHQKHQQEIDQYSIAIIEELIQVKITDKKKSQKKKI